MKKTHSCEGMRRRGSHQGRWVCSQRGGVQKAASWMGGGGGGGDGGCPHHSGAAVLKDGTAATSLQRAARKDKKQSRIGDYKLVTKGEKMHSTSIRLE